MKTESKKLVLFKRVVVVDIGAERARVQRVAYNKRQRAALLKLLDLFEQGD